MKRISLLLGSLTLLFCLSLPAQAFSIGVTETERHAGINWTLEVFMTPDANPPKSYEEPFAVSRSNVYEHKLPNQFPGISAHYWLLVKAYYLNEDEINDDEAEVSEAQELPYSEALGGYLLDVTSLKAGRYFIGLSLDHEGGRTSYNILATLWRSTRNITDETGFFITVFNPGRAFNQAEVVASVFMEGFELSNGALPYQNNLGQTMPLNLAETTPQNGTLTVEVYNCDRTLASEATVYLSNVATGLKYQLEGISVTFNDLPAGLYEVFAVSENRHYSAAVFNQKDNLVLVNSNQQTTIVITMGEEENQ